MKKPRSKRRNRAMKAEYDFSGGIRGKYADRYYLGTNVVLLEQDVAAAFPKSKLVNEVLRALIAIAAGVKRG
jgi:hypothetical protein